jgi:hypothetical protein
MVVSEYFMGLFGQPQIISQIFYSTGGFSSRTPCPRMVTM